MQYATSGATEVCQAGHYWDGDKCDTCSEFTWAAEGSDDCAYCPEGTYVEEGQGTAESDCRIRPREREAGEIAPQRATQSGTCDDDETNFGASRAIDLIWDSSSCNTGDIHGNYWFKLIFDGPQCIAQIIDIGYDGYFSTIWTCDDTSCTITEDQNGAGDIIVNVGTEGNYPGINLPTRTDCRYGDYVFFFGGQDENNRMIYREIAAYGPRCPAGQYMTNDGDCVNCGQDQYSSLGSDTCSNCPEGTSVKPGEGATESDCKMSPNSAKSVMPAAILLMMSALAIYC